MPVDPQAKQSLEQRAGAPAQHEVSPSEARAMQEAQTYLPGPEIAAVEDLLAPGPHGDIPVRVYHPEGSGPFPVTTWFHGGGWVVGNLRTNDATCRTLAKQAETIVVSVDYRLAPEHKFPIPMDDCYAATCWVAKQAASFGGDPSRLAVAGASAGGNLAAGISLRARDEHGPSLVHQSLIYPVTDMDFNRPSYQENGEGYGLSYDTMRYFWDCYLSQEADAHNPYAVPMDAGDLSGLPSAFVLTAEYDPLRDEGEAYANRLRAAGVPTTQTRYDGMIHGFFNAGMPFDRTWDAIAEAAGELRKAFGTG